ncbi:MAG: zinc ribbon domain-containing protein [Anaerolineae bacterium]|nr:zinc ribbon domain-containing protein [Anaerolineae bacterium]
MKCPICNFENPPPAARCEKCGYGFVQVSWPEIPVPDIASPAWPDLSGLQLEIPAAPTTPAPPAAEEAAALSDDELARMHMSRGFQALRKGLLDQAQWEFAQARDLADDLDIVRTAEAQLRELQQRLKAPAELTEPAERLMERLEREQEELQQKVRSPEELADQAAERVRRRIAEEKREIMPELTIPPAQPVARPTPAPAKSSGLGPAVSTGLMLGVLNGALTACGAFACVGFLVSPLLGLGAGLLTARRGGISSPTQGWTAGALTGLLGWVGQIVGHLLWSSSDVTMPDTLSVTACLTFLYIPLSAVLGLAGWKLGTGRRKEAA